MKEQTVFEFLTESSRKLLYSIELLICARRRNEDFTRNRTMPFTDLMLFMINLVRGSTQVQLNRFFENIKEVEMKMKQQSFSEARSKIQWEACRMFLDNSVESYYEYHKGNYDTFEGYRLLAVDGSKQQLPSDGVLREIYGTYGRGDAVTGQGSTLYDVINNIIIDARLEPISTDERTLALEHIEILCSLASFNRELILVRHG